MGPPVERPTNIRWAVFALACGTSWWLYLHRYVFAFIKPELTREFGLKKDELGLLESAFSLSYSLFQFPLGLTVDAIGVQLALPALIILWCIGLGMHAAAPSPRYLWFALGTLGVGQSAAYAAINRIGRVWYPPSIRTTLHGLAGITAGRVGGLSAYLLFGTLLLGVLGLDWRMAYYVLAAAGVVHAALFFFVYRNSPKRHGFVNDAEANLIEGPQVQDSPAAEPARVSIGQMLREIRPRAIVNLLCLNVQSILSTFADNIYSSWIPLFLWEVHELKFTEMGIYSSLPLLGGAIAGFVGGVLNDKCIAITGNRRWSRSGVAFAGKGLAAALLFTALFWYKSPYVFCLFLFLVKLFGDWSLTTAWGVTSDIGGRATASVFAFNNAVASLGLIAAPAVYGYVAEHYGWKIVFMSAATAYVLCALSWLTIDCTIPVIQGAAPKKNQ